MIEKNFTLKIWKTYIRVKTVTQINKVSNNKTKEIVQE